MQTILCVWACALENIKGFYFQHVFYAALSNVANLKQISWFWAQWPIRG